MMYETDPHVPAFRSRRDFLRLAGGGFGALALSAMLAEEARGEKASDPADPFAPRKPHFDTKARACIFLFMEGGPSHIDTFDPKPELRKRHGKPLPESYGKVVTPMGTGGNTLLADKGMWAWHGLSGLDVSVWVPNLAVSGPRRVSPAHWSAV
jgi:hypothetical protein